MTIYIAETHTLKIPRVWHYGELSNGAFLIMEHMSFGGHSSQEELGRGLAKMHLAPLKVSSTDGEGWLLLQQMLRHWFDKYLLQDPHAQAGQFGFEVDNTIGGTDQVTLSLPALSLLSSIEN